jgi:tetratricopeptide (TPR) repeat protein
MPFLAESVIAQGRQGEGEALFQECRQKARCVSRLAQIAQARGDEAGALVLLREVLDLEPTGVRKNDYAQALHSAGKGKEAEALFRQALGQQKPGEPETAITQNNLASLLTAANRHAEAELLQRQALATMKKTLGPRHVRTGLAASNLADIVRARGREPEARALYKQALRLFEELLPPGHPWTEEARAALAAKP